MSKRRNRSINVTRYWFTALCFVLNRLCFVGFVITIGVVAYLKDFQLLVLPGTLFAGFLATGFMLLVNGSDVICPLCRTPVFKGLGGSQKSATSKRFGFATKLIFRAKDPKCIHCKEPFRWL